MELFPNMGVIKMQILEKRISRKISSDILHNSAGTDVISNNAAGSVVFVIEESPTSRVLANNIEIIIEDIYGDGK